MLKKNLKRVVALLLTCLLAFALTACDTSLKGTYTNNDGPIAQSFIFREDNKVAVSAFDIQLEGDYTISEGNITITYSLLGFSYDWVKSFEKDGDSIFIDGKEFVKEK